MVFLSYVKMQTKRVKANSTAQLEAAMLAAQIRKENLVNLYKVTRDHRALLRRQKAYQDMANQRYEFQNLIAAHQRLPISLQSETFQRLRDLSRNPLVHQGTARQPAVSFAA